MIGPHSTALFPDTPICISRRSRRIARGLPAPKAFHQGTGGGVLANRSEPAGSKLGNLFWKPQRPISPDLMGESSHGFSRQVPCEYLRLMKLGQLTSQVYFNGCSYREVNGQGWSLIIDGELKS